MANSVVMSTRVPGPVAKYIDKKANDLGCRRADVLRSLIVGDYAHSLGCQHAEVIRALTIDNYGSSEKAEADEGSQDAK